MIGFLCVILLLILLMVVMIDVIIVLMMFVGIMCNGFCVVKGIVFLVILNSFIVKEVLFIFFLE